jgi:hypothetical protein
MEEGTVTFRFVEENRISRERLERVARGLTDEELRRANADGWTAAALLAHLAFWDNRIVTLLRRWKAQGVDESPVDSDMINDSLRPLALALEPRAAVELCLQSAAAADAEVETVTDALMAEIEASPTHFRFNRALHRNDHLGAIERMVGRTF